MTGHLGQCADCEQLFALNRLFLIQHLNKIVCTQCVKSYSKPKPKYASQRQPRPKNC